MIIVTLKEGYSILNGVKVETLRPIRANGKGYAKIGAIHEIRTNRNFKEPYLTKVLIIKRSFVNVEDLTDEDAKRLGYSNVGEYMSQSYNQRNPSPERVKYEFIELNNLLNDINNSEWGLNELIYYLDLMSISPKLLKGINKDLIFEGCEIQNIIDAFEQIRENIKEIL